MKQAPAPWWQNLLDRIGKWFTTPWKVTATAIAGLVIIIIRPILQSVTEEVIRAVADPATETDPWLQPIAVFAHRSLFIGIVVVCETVIVGAGVVLMTRFFFYIVGYIKHSLPRNRRLSQSQRRRSTRSIKPPKRLPPPIHSVPERKDRTPQRIG